MSAVDFLDFASERHAKASKPAASNASRYTSLWEFQ